MQLHQEIEEQRGGGELKGQPELRRADMLGSQPSRARHQEKERNLTKKHAALSNLTPRCVLFPAPPLGRSGSTGSTRDTEE